MTTELAVVREAPTGSGSLVPANMEQAMRLAEIMSQGRLVPSHLQSSPADCLLVIDAAARWGLSPFAVAQSTSVISGKLMYEGKLVAAVINARGELSKRLAYDYSGEGEKRTIRVYATLRGETTPREVSVCFKDARTTNRMWQTQPDQQLMYHGARVWARRHMPELMLGVWSPDEFPEEAPRGNTHVTAPSFRAVAASLDSSATDATNDTIAEDVEAPGDMNADLVWEYDRENKRAPWEPIRQAEKASNAQLAAIHILKAKCKFTDALWKSRLMANFGVDTSALLSKRCASELIDKLEEKAAHQAEALERAHVEMETGLAHVIAEEQAK